MVAELNKLSFKRPATQGDIRALQITSSSYANNNAVLLYKTLYTTHNLWSALAASHDSACAPQPPGQCHAHMG